MQVAGQCILRGNEDSEQREKYNNWSLRRNTKAIQEAVS